MKNIYKIVLFTSIVILTTSSFALDSVSPTVNTAKAKVESIEKNAADAIEEADKSADEVVEDTKNEAEDNVDTKTKEAKEKTCDGGKDCGCGH